MRKKCILRKLYLLFTGNSYRSEIFTKSVTVVTKKNYVTGFLKINIFSMWQPFMLKKTAANGWKSYFSCFFQHNWPPHRKYPKYQKCSPIVLFSYNCYTFGENFISIAVSSKKYIWYNLRKMHVLRI